MANKKLTELTEITQATVDDLIYLVDDPLGTPVSKKITVANFLKAMPDVELGLTSAFYIGDSTTDGSWRFIISGTDLLFQRRESGAWVDKGIMTA
jgi:hypothetical protein